MSLDEADHASELEERERAHLIKQAAEAEATRRRVAESHRPAPPIDEPQDCIECGEEIDIERLRRLPRTRRCDACGLEAERHYAGEPHART